MRLRDRCLASVALALVATAGGCRGGGDDASPAGGPTTTSTLATVTTAPVTATTSATATTTTTSTTATTSTTTVPGEPGAAHALVWPRDFPDPFVLTADDGYYAYATQAGLLRIQRLSGPTLEQLDGPTESLAPLPGWASAFSTWAPAVLTTPDGYVMYYSALVAGTQLMCIGAAFAPDPTGPFVDGSPEPFLCPREIGGAIDASPFVDTDGRVYLLWKNDGVTLRRESSLWSLPLRADGTSAGEPSAHLLATDQPWEYPHVEAPSMARVGDSYWLAYSGNWWNQDAYGVGLARCDGPLGPCHKPFDRPVLATRPGAFGPGGLEFFSDAGGSLHVAYHAWREEPGYPGDRALWIGRVDTSGPVPTL